MARIPQQYRAPLITWVQNNIHKCVHTEAWTTFEEVEGEPTDVEHSVSYLDTHELALRLGRKVWKAAPELRGKFDLHDLEELIDDKISALLNLAGVDSIGSGPRKYRDYKDEDPDT